MDVIFENERYRVVKTPARSNSNISILYFHPHSERRHHTRPSPFNAVEDLNFITKHGMNGIFIQSRRNDWYQHPSIFDALQLISSIKDAKDTYISYGLSMGGHAAISFAPHLAADYFVALAPQASLSPEFMREIDDERWKPAQKLFKYDRILDGDCQSCNGVIFLDNSNPQDLLHSNYICANSQAQTINCPGTWHLPGSFLNREFGLMSIVATIGELLSDKQSLSEYLGTVQSKINSSFLATFMAADPHEKVELLCQHGIERIRAEVKTKALWQEALRTKSPEVALIMALTMQNKENLKNFANAVAYPGLATIAGPHRKGV